MNTFLSQLIRRISKYGYPLFSILEKPLINYYAQKTLSVSPVFIVGAPRTGSTALYQIITHYLDVTYFNNLANLGRENLFLSLLFSNFIYKGKPHNCFKSEFGDTNKFGMNAPAEAGQFWYRWLSKELIYIDRDTLSINLEKKILTNIQAILARFNKPLVVKNLNFSQRLQMVAKLFPNAKIIFIKRDPIYTAQSIFIGRKKNSNTLSEWWSVKPKEYPSLHSLNIYDQIAGQVYYIEKQITEDISSFKDENVITLNYENLASEMKRILSDLRILLNCSYRRNINFDDLNNQIKIENSQKISDEEFSSLKKALLNLYKN